MTRPLAFQPWMTAVQARMEAALARHLPPADALPARLHDAMRYATLGGGKRVRPLLVFAAGELAGAADEALEVPAAAVEMIHAYSLIHDDLPCMDDDSLRRGKPTVHVEFDYATALLAGDALQAQAFLVLAGTPAAADAASQLRMVELLAQAAGSRGMCGGQQIDLDAVGRRLDEPELEMMHIHKTGALIRASVMLGALCGAPLAAAEGARLDHFAKCAGLLFQVVDDILDATADTATLGKTAGKDQKDDKPTYVSILGLGQARIKARALEEEALAALAPFGERGQRLAALARFIAGRSF
ncbi:MAG: polyprenyl synthetase family protein [Burkholderiales bacterium]|nr:polyprenyl synthetase family protein [Burkholderiales bacterium]